MEGNKSKAIMCRQDLIYVVYVYVRVCLCNSNNSKGIDKCERELPNNSTGSDSCEI